MFRPLTTLLVTIVLVGSAGTTEAQIYSWRNADGVLVFSDTPRTPAVATIPVRGTTAVRTTHAAPPVPGRSLGAIILREATRQGVRPELVRAVIQVESAFDPRARSSKGAKSPLSSAARIASSMRWLRGIYLGFAARIRSSRPAS